MISEFSAERILISASAAPYGDVITAKQISSNDVSRPLFTTKQKRDKDRQRQTQTKRVLNDLRRQKLKRQNFLFVCKAYRANALYILLQTSRRSFIDLISLQGGLKDGKEKSQITTLIYCSSHTVLKKELKKPGGQGKWVKIEYTIGKAEITKTAC